LWIKKLDYHICLNSLRRGADGVLNRFGDSTGSPENPLPANQKQYWPPINADEKANDLSAFIGDQLFSASSAGNFTRLLRPQIG
jgi:hypothetical protein